MRKVLVSLKPYYYYLVGEGIKKIEVRKTMPRASDWNKEVLFYMSKDVKSFAKIPKEFQEKYRKHFGKVGMQFVCDRIDEFTQSFFDEQEPRDTEEISFYLDQFKMSYNELWHYVVGLKNFYGWHISDLTIYDYPKELSEFYTIDESGNDCCIACVYHETPLEEMPCRTCTGERKYLYRPPQSWQYVEEL